MENERKRKCIDDDQSNIDNNKIQKNDDNNKIQKNDDIDIFTLVSKKYLNIFDSYIKKIKNLKLEISKTIEKRNKNKLKDDDLEYIEARRKINILKHNLYCNYCYFESFSNKLLDIKLKLKDDIESLCDHDIYSESHYHNERYYFCKKCTYGR